MGVERVQRHAVDIALNQEMMIPGREVAVDGGHGVQAGQFPQDVVLTPEPGHGVASIGGETCVGPRLLEHDPVPGSRVRPRVDPAAVREVQRLVDLIGQVLEGDRVARREMGDQEGRQRDPFRKRENRAAHVGD